jgi:hypothetical protein
MVKWLCVGLAALAVTACGTIEPPSVKVEADLLEVTPTNGTLSSAREIMVRLRVRNTTASSMWLLPGDFWYHPRGGGVTISQASSYTSIGNSSDCSAGPVRVGGSVSCRLFFEWSELMRFDVLVPGVIRWSDKSGYSHPDANGSVWVMEWIGFEPP